VVEYKQNTINLWFPEQEEPVYDPSDPISDYQFKEYWVREKDRCMNGFFLADGQVFIPGRLYFFTVYWKIAAWEEIGEGKKKRKIRRIITPLLRDLDWIIANDLEQCQEEGKFYSLVGSRDFGKSIWAGLEAGRQYTFYNNSESIISGGQSNYIKLVTDKIEDGLTNIHPIFKKQRLKADWKTEVRAGWKDKSSNLPSEKSSNSHILIINYENGNKTMAANGTRPGFHLIDEIGTIKNLIGCIKDSDGCWWSGGGDKPSCLTMYAGTGGDMEVGHEAAEVFFNPEAYSILSFENHWEDGKPIGRFIPVTMAKLKYKIPKTLSEYLGISHPDLDRITILVSDEEACLKEWWEPEYKKAIKSGNPKTVLKFKAYWPLKPSDSFIVLTQNDFNVEAAKAQQQRIKNEDRVGTPVRLFHDGEKILHEQLRDRLPISEFPVKTQAKDAPIVIWEHPISNSPYGLYVAGVDPYRQDESEYSDSLGAIYIYKRMHSIVSEKFQDTFVAAYVARPRTADEWCENARLLIKYYNAVTLVENDDMTFIRYMMNKGDGHMIHDQPEWLKEVVPNTKQNRPKGISRASKQIRSFLDGCLKNYLDEVIYEEKDENGSTIREVLGVHRVFDPMLLEEIIKFSKDGNFDRVVAAELALALADKMKPLGKVNSVESDPRFKSLFNKNKASSSMFGGNVNIFNKRGSIRKLFG